MKDNISIIFAAIIGTFLIVILPLFSILDRQDSMSYNVVLTATTNFVDDIRNNGFIDRDSYNKYLAALASTSNTYKVTIEAYKKKLIHDTDEEGNILQDKFSEEKELFNVFDISSELEKTTNNENSNKKGNIYLFDENDEIYIKVRNTNLTAGSLMYRFLSGITNTNVINISYGGVINNINWEQYAKLKEEQKDIPEVIMAVPVNANGKTNITKASGASIDYLEALSEQELSEEEKYILKNSGLFLTGKEYAYFYDLTKEENKTINISVELKNIDSINVINQNTGKEESIKIDELINNEEKFKEVKSGILKYIELNGMYASKDVVLRKDNEYYFFDISLTNVRMASLDYISSIASVTILPGLGQDVNGVLSLGTESVKIELMDELSVNSVVISGPYNFKKLLLTTLKEAVITVPEVFVQEDLAFVVSYTGINQEPDDVKKHIIDNLNIYNANHSDIKVYTLDEFKTEFGGNSVAEINTGLSNHIIVRLTYTEKNNSNTNYIELNSDWIATNIDYNEEEIEEAGGYLYAPGAKSEVYAVLVDEVGPIAPEIILEGTLGENDWYTSNVNVSLAVSTVDLIKRSETYLIQTIIDNYDLDKLNENVVGGSGVYKNYISMTGATKINKTEYVNDYEITSDGTTNIIGYVDDYLGNEAKTSTKTLKIDKTAPTKPVIEISGNKGNNGWYKSDVAVSITPGKDATSGVSKTTYFVEGANDVSEREGTSYTLNKEGISVITARTYDNAGNYSESKLEVKIEKTLPPNPQFEIVSGNSRNGNWYYTDVTLKITLSSGDSVSSLGTSKYRVKEKNSDANYIDFTENEKNITISESGEYTVTVITYTQAGNSKTNEINIKIDKEAPKPVTISPSGTLGDNQWYTSSVNVILTSNGDNGPSGEVNFIRYSLDGDTTETEVTSGSSVLLSDEKEHTLTVYSIDNAGNRNEITKTIKIDKTKPEADFKIIGNVGNDNWYKSDVEIEYNNAIDTTSGIKNIDLSDEIITEDTTGKEITLRVVDNAGNTNIKKTTIKVDKTAPTEPVLTTNEPTGSGLYGVMLFNKNVTITITPGDDETSGVRRTTYFVKKDNRLVVDETDFVQSYTISENGYYIVTARTYDNAGNYSESSKTILINKDKPSTLVINSINDENVKDSITKTITKSDNNLRLLVENIEENTVVLLTLINQSSYEVTRKEYDSSEIINGQVNLILNGKGKYAINITQTNMFGSTSDNSTGTYYYEYE